MSSPSVDAEIVQEIRAALRGQRGRIVSQQVASIEHAQEMEHEPGDSLDHASDESIESTEFRLRDREKKLVSKIDKALARLESGDYWYCQSCEEEIGVARLRARPVTNLCISCKEEQEEAELRTPKIRDDGY